jgi:DNA-binding IclR family transcriptional regulator
VKERAGIQSVEVGYSLLQALGQAAGPLMLRDLAASAGMSAAKAHRYLVSFQRLGLVIQDSASTRYDLGPSALRLGLAALSRLDAVKLARERLPGLMSTIEHTLALAVWGNRGPTVIHWEESPHAITVSLRLGDVMPLLTSATGLCFAAYTAREAIAPLLREEMDRARRQGRKDVPTSMDAVDRLLAEVRERGIARVVDTLLPGVVGFCAPVFDSDSHLVLGIVTMGPTGSFDPAWEGAVATPLIQTARRLSADLGCRA